MLDGRVLGASQVEYKPFGKPPYRERPAHGRRREPRPCAPPSWPGPSSASGCPGPPRQWRCGPRAASCGVQRGELVAQVRRDHEVPVVPRQLLCDALHSAAHRLGVLVLQSGLPGEDVHHHQAVLRLPRVFWLKSMRLACSRSLGPSAADLPSARGRGACTCRPTSAFSASGLRHVEVALPHELVQLPRVPHVEVVGQVPQRALPQKGACSRFAGCRDTYFLPQKGA